MSNFKKIFILSAIVVAFGIYIGFYGFAMSANTQSLSGYGWNADTSTGGVGGMGWLGFNGANYGVDLDKDAYLLGYAWSSNYGWIKFGGLADFPVGAGTTTANAQLINGELTGWARACSTFQSGCSGDYYYGNSHPDPLIFNDLSTNPYLGGWDGWISLSGNSLNGGKYGVTFSGKGGVSNATGYAWGGGGYNIGWIDFSQVKLGIIDTSYFTLVSDKTFVTASTDSFNLTLQGSGLNSNSGVATGGDPNWINQGLNLCPNSGSPVTYGPRSLSEISSTTTSATYTLTCTTLAGNFLTKSVTITLRDVNFCINNPTDPTCKKTPHYIER